MTSVITARTAAYTSHSFTVQRNESVGVRAFGLATTETIKIQIANGDGTWADIIDADGTLGGTLTATQYQTRIIASGKYRLVKSLTVGLAGADID